MDFTAVDTFYDRVRKTAWLNTFVILTRYLIAFAFIPSGLKKIAGERFTQMGTDTQIGFFFEALYQSGFYWNFIGWAQLVSAFLMMTQRFATLGAIFFFFIISNICVITISMKFSGTWVITSLMLLAIVMMLLWDFHKLEFLFYTDNFNAPAKLINYPTYNQIWIVAGFVLFIISVAGSLLLEKQQSGSPIFSRLWLGSILLTVAVAVYLNNRKNKK